MKKLVVFAVCAIMALAVMVPFGRVLGVDPIGDPPDPADVDFVSIETLPQNSGNLSIGSLMGKIIVENPEDSESTEAPQTVKYGFYVQFPGYETQYRSSEWWVDDGEISSVGEFPVWFKKQRQGTEPFENFIRRVCSAIGQNYFYYVFYAVYTRQNSDGDDEESVKFGYKNEKGEWHKFDLTKQPKSTIPKNSVITSKIFSMVDIKGKATKKFEVSQSGSIIELEWVKTRIKAIGVKGDYKVYFEFYACDAYNFSTKDIDGEYLINKDGTFLVGFKNSENENEDSYNFADFWEQAKNCSAYVRCVIEDKDKKVVFRSTYYRLK
jgi:hypothetical protein